jgi:competence protein ComEC
VGRGWPKAAADVVCVAVAAQLVTAPLVAAVSGRLSLVAVVANLAVAPVIPVITVLGTAGAALSPVWPAGADLLIRFTGPLLWWLLGVAAGSAEVPGAAITVPSGWAGLALLGGVAVAAVLGWRRIWFRAVAAGAVLCGVAWSVSGVVGWA